MKRLKLLFVTTYDPELQVLGGGAFVDKKLLLSLRREFDVELFVIVDDQGERRVPLELGRDRVAQLRTLARMAFRAEPYQEAKFKWSFAWNLRVADFASIVSGFDVIVTSQWPAMLLCEAAGVNPDVHVAHNVDTILAEEFDPKIFRLMGNAARMRARENELLHRSGVTFAISLTDVERMRAWGIDADHLPLELVLRPDVERPAGARVGFLGKAAWPPNRVAIEALVDELLPALRADERGAAATVVLAGRGTERWSGRDGVVALGAVANVEHFYRQIDIVVVPRLTESTGISIKMLEAIEQGCDVVAPGRLADDAAVAESVRRADTVGQMVEHILDHMKSDRKLGPTGPVPEKRPDSYLLTRRVAEVARLREVPSDNG